MHSPHNNIFEFNETAIVKNLELFLIPEYAAFAVTEKFFSEVDFTEITFDKTR